MTVKSDVQAKEVPGAPRGELLQLRTDRRLGHEWDDWDEQPLPNGGVFETPARVFFGLAVLGVGVAAGIVGAVLWLVGPRLAGLWGSLPGLLGWTVVAGAGLVLLWLGLIALSLRLGRPLLPPGLAERGPLARLLLPVTLLGRLCGISRDRVGNAGIRIYNGLAAARNRQGVRPDEVLVLLPRCLGKEAMQGAMEVAGRYGVPLFVAARGMYARKMIAMRRPRRIVAIACERDLVSGIHDVATRLPVLGTTLGLPDGPCKNTTVDMEGLEGQIRASLGLGGSRP